MVQTRRGRAYEQTDGRAASRARPTRRPVDSASAKRRQGERTASRKPRPAGERQGRVRNGGTRSHERRPGGGRIPDERQRNVQTARQKKQRKKWGIGKVILTALAVFAMLGGIGYLSVVVFRLQQIEVTHNLYTSSEAVIEWNGRDPLSDNTLYVWWKYNHGDFSELPAVESVHAKIKSPREVVVEVKEKTFVGRVEVNGEFLYFDKEGIVSYKSGEVIDGIALIEGVETDSEKVQMGKVLPVSDTAVFEKIKEISGLLGQNELKPDKLEIAGTDLSLWFGGVKILLGDGRYASRMEQIPPILGKLNELYPGQNGVLHLENYEQGTEFIRFEPDHD